MFKIYDGREFFYQWDLDRKIIVEDTSITQVHFCNRTDECSLVCEVYEEDGLRLVNVPNILLQSNWRINVYAYDRNYTKHSEKYNVVSRSKPDNYVYTETEILNFNTLLDRVNEVDENIAQVVNDYLKENPVEVDLTGYAKEEYVDNAIAAIPEPDLSNYATKPEMDSAFKEYYGRYRATDTNIQKNVQLASSFGNNYSEVGRYLINHFTTIGSTFMIQWDLPDETTTYGVYYNSTTDKYATGVNVKLKQNHYYKVDVASYNFVKEQKDKYWSFATAANVALDEELGVCWGAGLVKDLSIGGLACICGNEQPNNYYYIFRDITSGYAFDELEDRVAAIEQNGGGGSGDVDLSNYYTKAEIDALIPASGEGVSY